MLQGMVRPDYHFDEDLLLKKDGEGKAVQSPPHAYDGTTFYDVGDLCEAMYYGDCRPIIAHVKTTERKIRLFNICDLYMLFPETP